MITALVSLTWEIKGQPNCAQKQVFQLLLLAKHMHTLCIRLTIRVQFFSREVYNSSYSGPWCKELQCFYKIDISVRGFILGLLLERCSLILHSCTFNFITIYSNFCCISFDDWSSLSLPKGLKILNIWWGMHDDEHWGILLMFYNWWLLVLSFYQ